MEQEHIIFGGIDSFSEQLVDSYINTMEERGWDKNRFYTIHLTGEDPLGTLKTRLANIREELKEKGINSCPGLVFAASAFDLKGHENLSILKQISDILKIMFPGAQSLTLVVLLPPQTAEDSEKIATFRFFLELEKEVYHVPFLNSVFVNQLSMSMFKQSDSASTPPDEALFRLMDRQLLDTDLGESIKSIGTAAIANRTSAAGRKSYLTTTGIYQLEFFRDECLRYLSRRLQKDILELGLKGLYPEETDKKSLQAIQTGCDDFIDQQIEKYGPAIKSFFSVDDDIKLTGAAGEITPDESMKGLLQQFYTALDKMRSKIKNDLIAINESLDNALLEFLRGSPEYFHGADLYLKALAGELLIKAENPEETRLSGIARFQYEIYLAPISSSIKTFIIDLFSKYGITLPVSLETRYDNSWYTTAHEILESKTPDNQQAMPIYDFFKDCVGLFEGYTERTQASSEDIISLSNNICGSFLVTSEKISQHLKAIEIKGQELQSVFNQDYQDVGFWKRNISLRNEIKLKKIELQSSLDELNKIRQLMDQMKNELDVIIINIFNSIILPAMLRAIYIKAFKDALQNIHEKFESYISGLRSEIEALWKAALKYTRYKSSIVETVLDDKILTCLYSKVVGESSFTEHAKDLLAWLPAGLSEEKIKGLPYYSCRNLADHFQESYYVLIKRMTDYSDAQVAWAHNLDISDILETLGKDEEKDYFKKCLTRLDRFLELSPGLIPHINNLQQMFTVRSDQSVNADIIPKFDFMIGTEPVSVNNRDPLTIDLTMMRFGFPAFVIHRLAECRELYRKQYGEDEKDDLWPVLSNNNH